MQRLVLNGRPYSVTDKFAAAVLRVLGRLDFQTFIDDKGEPDLVERLELLALSNRRCLKGFWFSGHIDERGTWVPDAPVITPGGEYDRLQHLTHIRNIALTIHVVGQHHDPEEWGLDGWDAVHGNAWKFPCGCRSHLVFDHHSAVNHFGHDRVLEGADADLRKYFAIEPLQVCWQHRHHNDPDAHFRACVADHGGGQ